MQVSFQSPSLISGEIFKSEGTTTVPQCNYFDFAGMDTSVNPADDFYTYVNGKWLENNPIPDAYGSWGAFDIGRKKVNDRLTAIIKSLTGLESHEASLCKAFYESACNMQQRNAAGIQPIQHLLNKIDDIDSVDALIKVTAELMKVDVEPFSSWYVSSHPYDSSKSMIHLYEGGIGLPNYEILLEEKDTAANKHSEKRAKYRQFIADIFSLAGINEDSASEVIVRIETELAKTFMSKEDRRNPDKTINISNVQGFWVQIFLHWGINPEEVNVCNPRLLSKVEELIAKEPLNDLKVYMKFHVLKSFASSLGQAWYDLDFNFYSKEFQGMEKPLPIDERTAALTNNKLGQALGKLYVEKHFSSTEKKMVLDMVGVVKEVLIEKITRLHWLQESTKRQAIDKILKMVIEIGYPDDHYWTDYSDLTFVGEKPHASHCIALANFNFKESMKMLNKPIEKKEWDCLPQAVNAYNSYITNKITFPAGILDHPFFTSDEATTWGSIGAVISHEIIHSFDDNGRKYDADGNKRDWWQKEDAEAYEAHAKEIVEQFNHYSVTFEDGTSIHVNGKLTLGENIADLGGLKIAYLAMKKMGYETKDGLTPEQRFFLGQAQMQRRNTRDADQKLRMSNDIHSPKKWRINGPLSQMREFQEAFNLPGGCPMTLPDYQRSKMWD